MNLTLEKKMGSPQPFGVSTSKDGKGLNFAIFSRHATRITLVLEVAEAFEKATSIEVDLVQAHNRTGDVWHIQINNLPGNFTYGYRIDGPPPTPGKGHAYDFSKILLDPYCTSLVPRAWGEPSHFGERPCCMYKSSEFDWQGIPSPKTALTETVIYELHVRGFTYGKDANVTNPGTFAALTEKIPYIKKLGATAVELLPVTAFDETDCPFLSPRTRMPLKNYWGYNPLSLFALHPSYAADPANIITEFKTMVREFHRAGIEVYLDMVINHTGEGNYGGKTSCFRGIDNSIFYILDKNNIYQNYSGCGNTVNCNHPVVRAMIYDAMHYWAGEMRIDGFRFDLASIFSRGQQGEILKTAPVVERLAEDALLSDVKLIAEAWDAAGLYQVGGFSEHRKWSEWNGKFRDNVRSFMVGQKDTVSDLATRIAGSSDLYQNNQKSPVNSINFITSHDGFSLYDLVSYNAKHNESNGEQNQDGDNHNISWNSGAEGPTSEPAIQALRLRRMKSFMTILLLSQGVPMLVAGDEFARTQGGNNNAWCQDNPTSWLDWSLLKENEELFRFVQKTIALRLRYKIFGRDEFFMPNESLTSIDWQYLKPGIENWSEDCHGLAFLLKSQENAWKRDIFFLMFNGSPHQQLKFTLPSPPELDHWHMLLNSSADTPRDCMLEMERNNRVRTKAIQVPSFGAVVLQARLQ